MGLDLFGLNSYLVLLLVLPHISKGFRSSSENAEGLSSINFKPDSYFYLNTTNIGSHLVEDGNECGFACLETSSCFSYNLAASPNRDGNGKLLCELLPSDKYNNSDKLVASLLFHHFAISSPCSSRPCQNNGTCIPQYGKNSYVCICTNGYKGKYCQTDINECESNPCLNHGTCTDRANGFDCSCPQDFYGNRCETGLSISSTILSDNRFYLTHLAQFLASAVGNHSRWQLCHRASTHGWAASTFHNSCDGKRDTVTIVQKDQFVFGGYTDIPWVSNVNNYGSTSNAFIFSLRNNEAMEPFKSVVAVPGYAIRRRYAMYGPTFGRGYDLYIADNANTNNESFTDFDDPVDSNVYPAPAGTQNRLTILAGSRNFSPDDWEVFYLN